VADPALPIVDPAEPITPELVLVSPELRERAIASARQFPKAVQDTAGVRPEEPHARLAKRRSRVFVLAAAAVILVTGASVAFLSTRRVEPSLERVTRDGGGIAAQPNPTTTAPRQAQPAGVTTETARPTTQRPARRAERDVLNSPQFVLRFGVAGRRFVDPATRLFRAQVSIRCSQPLGATHLSCIVRRGNASLAFLYLRKGAHAFRLVRP
jgi:hypothetical protein